MIPTPDRQQRIDAEAERLAQRFPHGLAPVPVLTTERAGSAPDGTVIETPSGQPDLVVTVMTPLAQVAVRGLRTYVQGIVGFLGMLTVGRPVAESLGVVLPPGDFFQILQTAAGLAVAPTVISLLQNTAELLGRLDNLLPKARA